MPSTSFTVAVYNVELACGGSEEGGWWYDAGDLLRLVKVFRNEDKADEYCCRLNQRLRSRKFGPNAGKPKLSSTASDGEYQARVYEGVVPQHTPEQRPHYE